jgi:hypothetical protein
MTPRRWLPGATDGATASVSFRGASTIGQIGDRSNSLAGGLHVAGHDRKRLVVAFLAAAQTSDRGLVGRVGDQVVAAEPLHADDAALTQQTHGASDRVGINHGAVVVDEPHLRPAARAACRLGVEAPVGGVLVFGGASVAHGERRHRRQRPVVGQVANNRVPGSAVGAVDQGVAVPPVTRIEELTKAVGADGRVDGHPPAPGRGVVALDDPKRFRGPVDRGAGHRPDGVDAGEGRRLARQSGHELVEDLLVRPRLDRHPRRIVAHGSRQPEVRGQPVDERPEPHPLDLAVHAPGALVDGRRAGGRGHGVLLEHRNPRTAASPRRQVCAGREMPAHPRR